jgi:hypothetical protein
MQSSTTITHDIDTINDDELDDEFKDSDDETNNDINQSPNMQSLNQIEDVSSTSHVQSIFI